MSAADVSTVQPTAPLCHPKGDGDKGTHQTGNASVDILDIRRAALETNIKEDIVSQFHAKSGPRTLPTLLLYDEQGLQLFEDVSPANGRSGPLHGAN
jgi:hypothetical protein